MGGNPAAPPLRASKAIGKRKMSGIATVAATIFKHAGNPGDSSSPSPVRQAPANRRLPNSWRDLLPEDSAAVVPMDGFHYDDAVLTAKGLRQRKGAPETFDYRRLRGAAETPARRRWRRRHSGLRPLDGAVARRRRDRAARREVHPDRGQLSAARRGALVAAGAGCSISRSSSTSRATSSSAGWSSAGSTMGVRLRTAATG